jgi:uncharacterized membrane protein YcjF (UPF0283 family)
MRAAVAAAATNLRTETVSRARRFKKRADSVLEEVFRSLFEEIDTDVDALREAAPHFDRLQHARVLVRRTAIRTAAVGAVTGLPSGLLAIGTLGADLAYLMYQQFRLMLGIATIYGHEPSQRERFNEAISCLAYASGVGIGKTALEVAVIETSVVAEKIGSRFLRERLSKAIPFVGALSGGALNFISVRAVGRATIRYYESLIDPDVAEEIWASDGDREHA